MSGARFLVGDVFDALATLPDDSVDLIFSSPPFLALRSYLPADHPDKHKEIGSEATPADFIDRLLDVVEACDRVLAPHGSLCYELGDTYAGSGGAGGDYNENGFREGQARFSGSASKRRALGVGDDYRPPRSGRAASDWPLAKSLTGIPTLFAWSLAYGRNLLRPERTTEPWRIRNLVCWARPNPPVGALGDKWRPATSYVTVATKSGKRWFDLDAVRTPYAYPDQVRPALSNFKDATNSDSNRGTLGEFRAADSAGAPPLDYLKLPTEPYKGAHYATFPRRLVDPFVKSMCPSRVCTTCGKPSERITGDPTYERTDTDRVPARLAMQDGERLAEGVNQFSRDDGANTSVVRSVETLGWSDCGHNTWRPGVVLDPFAGSGTTLEVATGHGRDAIGIDLDSRNAELARERCGMFLEVVELDPTGEAIA